MDFAWFKSNEVQGSVQENIWTTGSGSTRKEITNLHTIHIFFFDSVSLSNHLIAHLEAANYTRNKLQHNVQHKKIFLKTDLSQLQTAASSPELVHLPTDTNLYLDEEDEIPFMGRMKSKKEPPQQQCPDFPPALQVQT